MDWGCNGFDRRSRKTQMIALGSFTEQMYTKRYEHQFRSRGHFGLPNSNTPFMRVSQDVECRDVATEDEARLSEVL